MSLSVIFNGIELNDLIDVEYGLNLTDGADWQPELRALSGGNGSDFLKTSYGSKSITMPFRIKNEINSKFDKLQRILNVSLAQRLSFGNLKNRYFVAIPSSKIDLIVEKNGFIARGTITWLIPDGASHSTDTKIVTASVVDGILTANVNNNGSDDIWPTYRIKNSTENGWNGIVHAGGLLEIGNREELDTANKKESKVLVDTKDFSEFVRYTGTNIENAQKTNDGTAKVANENGTNFFRLDNAGANNNYWHGASYVYNFPADETGHVGSPIVYSYMNSVIWADLNGQTGNIQVLFADKNNNLVMGYDIYKTDASGNSAVWTALAGDGKGGKKILKVVNFQTNHLDKDNPFNMPRGNADIYKSGENIRFFWGGSYPPFVVPELKDIEVTKCYINFYQWADRSGSKMMRYMDMRNIMIRNDVSKYIYDIKNRYRAGSEIVVDTESGSVYVDGMPSNGDAVNPPVFAPLKPGKNTIEFHQSAWAQSMPEITVEYKERWL